MELSDAFSVAALLTCAWAAGVATEEGENCWRSSAGGVADPNFLLACIAVAGLPALVAEIIVGMVMGKS